MLAGCAAPPPPPAPPPKQAAKPLSHVVTRRPVAKVALAPAKPVPGPLPVSAEPLAPSAAEGGPDQPPAPLAPEATPPDATPADATPADTTPLSAAPPDATRPPAAVGPATLVGLSQSAVSGLLGKPSITGASGPGQTWTYRATECSLTVAFFYDVTRGAFFALSAHAEKLPEQDCLVRLLDNPHGT